MKVLVTGGTGFVGREVLRELHAAGHHIRLLVRKRNSPAARFALSRYGQEVRDGDVLEPNTLPPALQGVDAVIHLVGIIAEHGRQTFENVHTRGTQNLIAACQIFGLKRFIHLSALGTKPNAASRYHQTKYAAEEAVCRSAMDWTIFRPSLIYGPGDDFVNRFVHLARTAPFLPVIGEGRARYQPVAVEHVARCLVGALEDPHSIRQTFDIGGPELLTLPQMLHTILQVTGQERRIVRVPMELARKLVAVLEFYYRVTGKGAPPLTRDQLIMLEQDNVGDCQWTTETFGLKQVSFAEGLAAYLNGSRPRRGAGCVQPA
jgi:NADH dehydrogenase